MDIEVILEITMSGSTGSLLGSINHPVYLNFHPVAIGKPPARLDGVHPDPGQPQVGAVPSIDSRGDGSCQQGWGVVHEVALKEGKDGCCIRGGGGGAE